MLKTYSMVIDENGDSGVDFNSFVQNPAHEKTFVAFNAIDRYQFNEEKRLVTGVMISVDTLIYRNSEEHGEHNVTFSANTVELARKKFFVNGFNKNINQEHNSNINGVVLIDSYIASNSDPKLPNIPQIFEKQNIKDGSWIATYFVMNEDVWNDVKNGKFSGFSVEGLFGKVEIKNKISMNKTKKSIWDIFRNMVEKQEFAEAKTADNVIVMYDGDLAVGSVVTTDVEGVNVTAPEGEHQLTLESGEVVVVTLDANGVVLTIDAVTEDMDEQPAEDVRQEVADAMSAMLKEINERFEALEVENQTFKKIALDQSKEIEAMKAGEKFKARTVVVGNEPAVMTISQLINNKK